jgi:hypothetical protein
VVAGVGTLREELPGDLDVRLQGCGKAVDDPAQRILSFLVTADELAVGNTIEVIV